MRWLQDVAQDVRHGFRLLRKNALFSAAVIGTLALGIGATSTIFTLVNGVLLRPLPYPNADRIVVIEKESEGRSGRPGQYEIQAWKESVHSLTAVGTFSSASAALTGAGEPITIDGGATSTSFLSILGARVELGRLYNESEEVAGAPRVVVLSHALWKSNFGGDSAAVNRTITLGGIERTVIGVMKPISICRQNPCIGCHCGYHQ